MIRRQRGPWSNPAAPPEGVRRLVERWNRTLDASALRSEMQRAIDEGKLEALDLSRIRTSPIKLESRRFVVSVDLGRRLRPLRLIVKGYWDDHAHHVYENHQRLWTALRGEAAVRTARPWGVIDQLGAIVMERVAGKAPDRRDPEAAARKARALVRLHSCEAPLTPTVDLGAAVDSAVLAASHVEKEAPEHGRGALDAAALARELQPKISADGSTPVHGDLDNPVFRFAGDRTYLIDWDTSCSFDPAWDLGYQLSQLHRWQLTQGVDTAASRESFLGTYLEAAGNPDLERRVAYFEALVHLSKAAVMVRRAKPGWRTAVPVLLRVARERLALVG